ncbi:MAG: hypothetical protein ACM3PF_03860 [Bacteroidota bacterium]
MIRSIEDKIDEARACFLESTEGEKDPRRRRQLQACADMAEAIREAHRRIDYLKTQLEEVRHALGRHVEVRGTVPHTRRPGRERPAEA